MSRIKWALGFALALVLTGSPAFAQSQEDTIAVASSDFDGLRPVRQGDNDPRVMDRAGYNKSIAQWSREHPDASPMSFDDIRAENTTVCSETGSWIRESIAIAGEAQAIGIELGDIREQLVRLGTAQNRASWIRRGFFVASTALLCTIPGVGWHYCAGAGANALAGETGGTAHDKAMKLNRRQSTLNVRQSELQLRATLLTMRENIAWAKMMQTYCTRTHMDALIGPGEGADIGRTAPHY